MPSAAESTSPSWRAAATAFAHVRRTAGALRRAGLELQAEALMAEAADALTRLLAAHGIPGGKLR